MTHGSSCGSCIHQLSSDRALASLLLTWAFLELAWTLLGFWKRGWGIVEFWLAVCLLGLACIGEWCVWHAQWRMSRRLSIAAREGRCPQCGYLLKGLPHRRCPECGRAFSLEEIGVPPEERARFANAQASSTSEHLTDATRNPPAAPGRLRKLGAAWQMWVLILVGVEIAYLTYGSALSVRQLHRAGIPTDELVDFFVHFALWLVVAIIHSLATYSICKTWLPHRLSQGGTELRR